MPEANSSEDTGSARTRIGLGDNAMLGIALKVISVTVFIFMQSGAKSLNHIFVGELVFFRSLFAVLPILVIMQWRGELKASLKTQRFGGHLIRTAFGTLGMTALFLALYNLPLPEATTLTYAIPLIIVVLSALILKEPVRAFRWTAVGVGAVGVLIVAWPRLSLFTSGAALTSGETFGVICAMVGACLAAGAMLSTRSLVATERSGTIVLYYSSLASILALLTLPFGWVMPSPFELAMLIGIGVLGGIGQILLTESYRHADMSVIAPFEYSSLLFAIVIGYFAFGETPTIYTLIGGLIVIAAGIAIILRERHLGLKRRDEARAVTPASGR